MLDGVEKWQKRPRSSTPSSAGPAPVPASAEPPARADEMTSVVFAEVARRINQTAAAAGLTTPSFRSPPRRRGLRRSITRRADGSATVSVALRGRPAMAVVADMIDGVLAANTSRASGSDGAAALGDGLWAAATPALLASPGRAAPSGRPVQGAEPSAGETSPARAPQRRAA